jgi:phage major head subunit gpT-like protein
MLTPVLLQTLETQIKRVSDESYRGKLSSLWWQNVANADTTTAGRTVKTWLLDSARLTRTNDGEFSSQEMYAIQHEYSVEFAGGGLEMSKTEFDDDDTSPIAYQQAAEWAKQMGAQFAYYPQRLVADALIGGNTVTTMKAYDGLQFFSTAHPNNPSVSAWGTYANLFTGGASGSYPGALPIDNGVTVDVAFANLTKLFAYVRGMKSSNGRDPRGLSFAGIVTPPALFPRVSQLLDAKYIAQAAAGGGAASADVTKITQIFAGFGTPICADEISAALGGSDTDYYVLLKYDAGNLTELGGLSYVQREPFNIVYNGVMDDAKLQRTNKLQWNARGRNTLAFGHPYYLLKCRAT